MRRLGRVSVAPVFPGQAPTHLDGGSEVRFEGGNAQADEPDEGAAVRYLERPEAEPVLGELDPQDERSLAGLLAEKLAGAEESLPD